MNTIKNPIIPGYYPDPSICRVGDDFYMVCSSFELYPGIPIFHSKDLMNWEQIGNVMTKENDFHVERSYGGNGVMAPTIRYQHGIFYVINANFSDKGNYIVTAKDPKGPWSMPHYLEDVPGIDASIFFDNDGKCYVMGTGNVWDNGTGVKERGFWIAGFDIDNFKMTGEPFTIFNSGLRNGDSPEAPHIYHIGEYYYLLFAEGGTEHYHSVMVARSKELFSFFEGYRGNPIMTHRMMGTYANISNVGHADIVDTPDGKWYAVLLASRNIDGVHKNLGRETYICPVVWESAWPLFSPKTGRLDFEYEGTGLKEVTFLEEAKRDEFDNKTFAPYWVCWGTPYVDYYGISDSKLNIRCIKQGIFQELEPVKIGRPRRKDAFAPIIARRQREFAYKVSCRMDFIPEKNESAGLAIVQAFNHQYRFERVQEDGRQYLQVVLCRAEYNEYPFLPGFFSESKEEVLKRIPMDSQNIILMIKCDGRRISFYYGDEENNLTWMTSDDVLRIHTEKNGCMTGTLIGMFASGNGTDSDNKAEFDWFELDHGVL